MKKWAAPLALVAIVTVLTGPALAGKPTSNVSGWIAVDKGESTMLASAATSSVPVLKYGGTADFNSGTSGKLASGSQLFVSVICTQDGHVVYQWSGDPSFSYPLTDQAGQGLEWNGQSADCSGTLVYRVINGKNVSITYLDTTLFHVEAA